MIRRKDIVKPDDKLVDRFRKESQLLSHTENRGLNFSIDYNSLPDLQSEHLRLVGGVDGKFYMPDRRSADNSRYHLAKIPDLQNRLKLIADRFKKYQQSELNAGNRKPPTMSFAQQEDYDIAKARLQIAMEERDFLVSRIAPLEKVKVEEENAILPRRQWKATKHVDGFLVEIGGFRVSMNEEKGVLCIDEPRCDYDNIEVYKFKGIVVGGMSREWNYRLRTEAKNASIEDRKRKEVKYPQAPILHKKKDGANNWEFPGYSAQVIKRITKDL